MKCPKPFREAKRRARRTEESSILTVWKTCFASHVENRLRRPLPPVKEKRLRMENGARRNGYGRLATVEDGVSMSLPFTPCYPLRQARRGRSEWKIGHASLYGMLRIPKLTKNVKISPLQGLFLTNLFTRLINAVRMCPKVKSPPFLRIFLPKIQPDLSVPFGFLMKLECVQKSKVPHLYAFF